MREFSKKYDHQLEASLYKERLKDGLFNGGGTGEPYAILLPPPNVTGQLHVGHTLMAAYEDAFARYHRMSGKNVTWLV
jgi:valyl-tRNA synthetase